VKLLRIYIPLRNDMVLVCLKMQVWTICRIFKRNITYKRQQLQMWRQQPAAGGNTPPPADSSSHIGSFQSDGRDEYMNRQPVITAPGISSHHQLVNHQMNMLNGGSCSFFRDSLHGQQWFNFNSLLTVPEQEQKPQVNPPAMAIACQQSPAANEFYRGSYLEEIARFMEISDPIGTAFYDCRYA
jgi:hypothetical protein